MRTAERIDERKYKRRHALSVRSGMVAGKDGQKSGFAQPWIINFVGHRTTYHWCLGGANELLHG